MIKSKQGQNDRGMNKLILDQCKIFLLFWNYQMCKYDWMSYGALYQS